jgi:hypothetical protein
VGLHQHIKLHHKAIPGEGEGGYKLQPECFKDVHVELYPLLDNLFHPEDELLLVE